jgi:hypothetical protein
VCPSLRDAMSDPERLASLDSAAHCVQLDLLDKRPPANVPCPSGDGHVATRWYFSAALGAIR